MDAPPAPAADTRDGASRELRAPEPPAATAAPAAVPAPARQPTLARPVAVEPLDAERVHVTLSREALAKLEAARDALSHAKPGASLGEVLEAALDVLLREHAKRKGIVAKPRKEAPPSDPGGPP